MPRKSNVKKPGVRSYGTLSNYSSEKLEEALQMIKSGTLTQRQAAKRYTIPRSTLNNKLRMKHNKSVGRPICLTMEEEIMFRDHLLALSDFGIPVGINDFEMLVKRYLTSINKVVPVFTDNTPGYEWGKLYLERHPALKEKIAHNISRKRAQVNEEMVNKFFDLLTLEADGVPPENIYNMDESGFHDDPGKQKLLFRRANRHPELIRNSTKSCFTVVFCGNAVGEFIPPFFIFKGKNCWSDWLQNAPKSSKMTVSKSGWIDSDIFDEWLEKHFIPIVDKKPGNKILLCDNLSAHISVKALKLCEEHNIKFICLIPNSTHLLQPLDVGFFSSLKTAWRSVLRTWRLTQRGRKAISLPKNIFSQLLKLTLDQCESTAGLNLIAGFRKCGIYPVSRREVLQILPGYAATDVQTSVGETFKEYLKDIRESDLNIKSCRKFQLPVEAGKAVSAEEVETFYKNKIDGQNKKKENPVKRGRPVGSKTVKGKKKKTIGQENNTAADPLVPKNMNIDDKSQSDTDLMCNNNSKTNVAVPETIVSNDDMDKENYCNTINVLHIGLEDTRAASPESDTEDFPIISTVVASIHTAPQEGAFRTPDKTPKTSLKKYWDSFDNLDQIEILQEEDMKTNKRKACETNKTQNKNSPKRKKNDIPAKKALPVSLVDEDVEIITISNDQLEYQLNGPTKEPEEAVAHLVGFENITGDFLVHSDGGKLVQINEQEEVFEEEPKHRKNKGSETDWAQSYHLSAVRQEKGFNEIVTEFPDRERVGPHTPEGEEIEGPEDNNNTNSKKKSKATAKRRNRRNKLKSIRFAENRSEIDVNKPITSQVTEPLDKVPEVDHKSVKGDEKDNQVEKKETDIKMADAKSREDVVAARQAKKQAKQKGKVKEPTDSKDTTPEAKKIEPKKELTPKPVEVNIQKLKEDPKAKVELKPKAKEEIKATSSRSEDEVDKAHIKVDSVSISDDKENIKAERAAKKAAKQAKKKGAGPDAVKVVDAVLKEVPSGDTKPVNEDMTVKDVVETLREIVSVAKDIKDVTDKVSAIDLNSKKPQPVIKEQQSNKVKAEESGKSKAELKAERRAKQEAQRAAKQASQEQKVAPKSKVEAKTTPSRDTPSKDEKPSKTRTLEKSKSKVQISNTVDWFQHLHKEHDKESLKSIPINSHLHPAIIKLGVQLASKVVTGSNARCIALLDALKKMVRDYTLPAKTEFGRGLEAHLAASVDFLWSMRAPSSSQTNAVKFFRYHLTQLPNNVDEFDAKKTLQEEIDRYIREQIDMAGEAISIAVRNKISNGDNILTYGCSSLIERILVEAWSAGVQFHTVVVGNRLQRAATHMLTRLVSHGLACTYVDISGLSSVMSNVSKVILGAGALLGNGAVLGAVGSHGVALAARARNVPVLVACETHKFCDRVQTDAFVYNEIGDPDDLIDKSDENSPLKDWRSNPNLTLLNLNYDVTPASLITAVVTELAILPCTSAPVVLRFKLSEYGV